LLSFVLFFAWIKIHKIKGRKKISVLNRNIEKGYAAKMNIIIFASNLVKPIVL